MNIIDIIVTGAVVGHLVTVVQATILYIDHCETWLRCNSVYRPTFFSHTNLLALLGGHAIGWSLGMLLAGYLMFIQFAYNVLMGWV